MSWDLRYDSISTKLPEQLRIKNKIEDAEEIS